MKKITLITYQRPMVDWSELTSIICPKEELHEQMDRLMKQGCRITHIDGKPILDISTKEIVTNDKARND